MIPRKGMGQWILNHVVQNLGYEGDVLVSYDQHMMYKYGSGRGRPGWAERIGKKYQMIALGRLTAKLADNVKPKEERAWEPKARGVPLTYARGRDIDPSLLVAGRQPRREGMVWWLPVDYDFAAVEGQSNAEWVASSNDVPSSETFLQPMGRDDGGQWQLLEGYPSWSPDNREDDEDGFKPHRHVWTQIRGYRSEERRVGKECRL